MVCRVYYYNFFSGILPGSKKGFSLMTAGSAAKFSKKKCPLNLVILSAELHVEESSSTAKREEGCV